MNHEQKLKALEKRIGYNFKNRDYLIQALTHGSYGDGRRKITNYERLEFLGDRVLGLMTAEILYRNSSEDEGALARKLNALVRKETCADVALELGLDDLIFMSKSAEKQSGRETTSILGDAAEALLGAIYLEGGFKAVKTFYKKYWHVRVQNVLNNSLKDPKTELQERAAAVSATAPHYELLDRTGPDHRPKFNIKVCVEGIGTGQGCGATKKDAERSAAANLLDNWNQL